MSVSLCTLSGYGNKDYSSLTLLVCQLSTRDEPLMFGKGFEREAARATQWGVVKKRASE